METLNGDVFSVVASFLTAAEGARLSTTSKEVSKLVLENKEHFQPSSFFKKGQWAFGHDQFIMVEHARNPKWGDKKLVSRLCTDHLTFSIMTRTTRTTNNQKANKLLALAGYKYAIYIWDDDACEHGIYPHYVSKEDFYRIRSDYALYMREKAVEQKKAAEAQAKAEAEAEYRRRHPVVPIKAPSKPAPWCKN